MDIIDSAEKLCALLDAVGHLKIYGAGYQMFKLLEAIKITGHLDSMVEMIIVSDISGTPLYVNKIHVQVYTETVVNDEDTIIFAVPNEAIRQLIPIVEKKTRHIYQVSSKVFSELVSNEYMYQDMYDIMRPFVADFNKKKKLWNAPCEQHEFIAWTCWWQGIDSAPDIVRACINSQRKNLPSNVKLVTIDKKNYIEYIDLPIYIMEKVENGFISITTLSDIIRSCLLYKYGGIWIDSTVMVHRFFPEAYFKLPLFSCKGTHNILVSYSGFSLWLMGGKSGNILFKFIMEAFFYYYNQYDRIKYYLTIDYLIEIAKNCFSEIKEQYNMIPNNNEYAGRLFRHLNEEFDTIRYQDYIADTDVQKLSWKFKSKFGIDEKQFEEKSVYSHIVEEYLSADALDLR